MSNINTLVINSSPRRDGNMDLMLGEVVSGMRGKGIEPKVIMLRELNIAPCRQCDGCLHDGVCSINDDMQWIHRALREANLVVMGSPVFFMGVTAQAKTMIDRCQALWIMRWMLKVPVPMYPGMERRGAFLSVGGSNLNNLFEPSLRTVKSWFKTLEFTYAGDLTVAGVDEKGAISSHPTALKQAFELGQRLAAESSIT
jgi:multimeric flavodoxin WrbA